MISITARAKRNELLADARAFNVVGDAASASRCRIFAANFALLASDDPAARERGMAQLKKNIES